jgi:excinuclease ABC subunit A
LAKGQVLTFSSKFACPVSGFTLEEIEPRLFSFNNPFGACPTCDGLGVKLAFDADLVIPDRDKALHKGAVAPWSRGPSPLYTQTLQSLARHYGFSMDVAWRDLPEQAQTVILRGTGSEKIKFTYDDNARKYEVSKAFEGVLPNLERRWRETDSAWVREELGRYQSETPCEVCHGKRLKPEALAVKIAGTDIAARILADRMPTLVGPRGRIIVENRAGAVGRSARTMCGGRFRTATRCCSAPRPPTAPIR